MKTVAPDRMVIDRTDLGNPRWAGVMTGVPHPGGKPPHGVRWLENGHESLAAAGPATRVESGQAAGSSS